MITAEVDTQPFEDALVRYKVAVGKSWENVIKEQARLITTTLIRMTPPLTFARGKRAIDRDVRRVFIPLEEIEAVLFAYTIARKNRYEGLQLIGFDKVKWRDPRVGATVLKAWREGRTDILDIIFERAIAKNAPQFIPMERPDHQFYKAQKRNGKLPKRLKQHGVISDSKSIEAYIKEVQQKVGITKAGWATAALGLNAKLPAWLSKHGTKYGDLFDNSGRNKDPSVTLVNRATPMASIDRRNNLVATALRGRVTAMKSSAEKQLERARKESGF